MIFHFKDILQHFKFVNWRIRGFVFWCREQVISYLKVSKSQKQLVLSKNFQKRQQRTNLFLTNFYFENFRPLTLLHQPAGSRVGLQEIEQRVHWHGPWIFMRLSWSGSCAVFQWVRLYYIVYCTTTTLANTFPILSYWIMIVTYPAVFVLWIGNINVQLNEELLIQL